ncbi:DoxX family protein [Xanthomonas euvesicatoria pv. alangii]|uniref:DoxX family protein n=1 Tax=Xanthomonas euvesicatoria TaxID=456327 RepID=UPI001C4870F5|nr:DoxX family protein [Xanthomonas euvesicatoria]MBV6670060.1 DoxX family protein [Xanthomonas euvesicatoria pv. alangii]
MTKPNWRTIVAWLLAAFFLAGGIGNIFVSEHNAAEYLRWGFPEWFHFVTGGLELSAALLIVFKQTRWWGACLGALIMLAALVTLITHGEYLHALAPLIVLIVSLTVALNSTQRKALS